MLKNIDAVLFDLDGTLVDSMWMWKQIDIEFLARFGLECPPDLQAWIEGKSFTETAHFFKEYFQIPMEIDEMKQCWNQMAYDKYSHEVFLKPGAGEFLKLLQEQGIAVGIATSNSRELAEAVIHALGLENSIQVVTTGCEVSAGKPAPDVYLETARKLKVLPEHCLVFEDIPMGILAGKNAGMKVCAVEDVYSLQVAEEKKALADWYIQDYFQLLEKLSCTTDEQKRDNAEVCL